ncbi:MAG: hypothetical protein N4A46_14475, partial [Schleiferiaceae bacterium]|nr:hypothetical protein [Schleiferiaceae bacterium]
MSMIGAALYLIDFMHHYGIDVLMGDRVDTWTPLLKEESFWSGFFKQHGPHRLGLLFILTKIGYELGLGFDTRFDLFVNAAVIYSIIPLGLLLKYRLTQKFNYYDLAIPFAIVAPWQWATLIINPHIHVMLPLFTLLMALFITSKFRDNLIINLALIFLAFFSVYALFAAFLFSAIQFYRWRNRLRKQAVVILLFIVCLFLFYFTDFRWITLGSTGPFQVLPALKGPVHLVSYFFNVPNLLGALIILISGYGFWKWFQENQKTVQASTVLFLVGSLSLFIFLQSVGRSGDDPSVYGASRY